MKFNRQSNIGKIDRTLRILGGIGLLVWALAFSGPLWAFLGVVPLTTALIRWCPLYTFLGIRSK